MMKKLSTLVILISSLLIVGCAQPDNYFEMASEFEPYYAEFVDFTERYNLKISNNRTEIIFGETDGDQVGVCKQTVRENADLTRYRTKQVVINRGFWFDKNVHDISRKELIFHELAHCLLGYMTHDNRTQLVSVETKEQTMQIGTSVSLMYYSLMSIYPLQRKWMEENWDYYEQQLFEIVVAYNPSILKQ